MTERVKTMIVFDDGHCSAKCPWLCTPDKSTKKMFYCRLFREELKEEKPKNKRKIRASRVSNCLLAVLHIKEYSELTEEAGR